MGTGTVMETGSGTRTEQERHGNEIGTVENVSGTVELGYGTVENGNGTETVR